MSRTGMSDDAAKEFAGEEAVSGRCRCVRLHSHRHWFCHRRRPHKRFSCLARSKRRISIKALRTLLTRIPRPATPAARTARQTLTSRTTTDTGGGYNLGWVAAGEWLKYTVNVTAAGDYNLEVRVAARGAGGIFHIEINGVDRTGPITIPETGGWQQWTSVTKPGLSLTAGTQVWRVVMDQAGEFAVGNINFFRVVAATPAPGPAPRSRSSPQSRSGSPVPFRPRVPLQPPVPRRAPHQRRLRPRPIRPGRTSCSTRPM